MTRGRTERKNAQKMREYIDEREKGKGNRMMRVEGGNEEKLYEKKNTIYYLHYPLSQLVTITSSLIIQHSNSGTQHFFELIN